MILGYLGKALTALWINLHTLLNDIRQSLQCCAVREEHHTIHSAASAYSVFQQIPHGIESGLHQVALHTDTRQDSY